MEKKALFIFIIWLVINCGGPELDRASTYPVPINHEVADEMIRNFRMHQIENQPFSVRLLQEYINLCQIKNPDVVMAQAVLETGNFSSKIFHENHNLFGMRLPVVRETVAIGSRYGHAVYKRWTDSVIDYAMWQDYNERSMENHDTYLSFINGVYAEDDLYIRKLEKILGLMN